MPTLTASASSDAALGAESATLSMPLLHAADLQDHLLMATSDLERLQSLLADTSELLMERFAGAFAALGGGDANAQRIVDAASLGRVRLLLGQAVTALQFQDMASQLIAHTHQRLRSCADQLAREAFGREGEDDDAVLTPQPTRPNPVHQDTMGAGSVDLF